MENLPSYQTDCTPVETSCVEDVLDCMILEASIVFLSDEQFCELLYCEKFLLVFIYVLLIVCCLIDFVLLSVGCILFINVPRFEKAK